MYTFVFMWTPALKTAEEAEAETKGETLDTSTAQYLGLIFAVFMVCVMVGSSIFKIFAAKRKNLYKIPLLMHTVAFLSMAITTIMYENKVLHYLPLFPPIEARGSRLIVRYSLSSLYLSPPQVDRVRNVPSVRNICRCFLPFIRCHQIREDSRYPLSTCLSLFLNASLCVLQNLCKKSNIISGANLFNIIKARND